MSQFAGRKAVKSPKRSCRMATRYIFQTALVLSVTLCVSSCASLLSGNSGNQNNQSAPAVAVSISPASARISSTGSVQFTARVAGTSNVGVTWSAVGGSISSSGLFTGDSGASSATITATSTANPTSSASVPVNFVTASKLSILTTALPGAQTGAPYSATLASSGGTPPYTWSLAAGSLPQGFV